jgi:hypothetical protein
VSSRFEDEHQNQAKDDEKEKDNAFPTPSIFLVSVVGMRSKQDWQQITHRMATLSSLTAS